MQVQDLILYQVATDRHYKVGDKFHFGDVPNGQEKLCKDISCVYQGKPLHQYVLENIRDSNDFVIPIVQNLASTLSSYDFAIRELAFEEVRRAHFPHLPSRFRCMFLTDSRDLCLKSLHNFYQKGHGQFFQAVEVKVSGEALFVRDGATGRFGLSYNDYLKKAEHYWAQDTSSTQPIQEILFCGDVEVISILDELEIN